MCKDFFPVKLFDPLDDFAWERLYRLEIQKLENTDAYAPEAAKSRFDKYTTMDDVWRRVALIYDVHDRTPSQLLELVQDAIEGESGRFRILIFYWEGQMSTVQTGKLMGRGQDFVYSNNPRGETISVADKCIEFDLKDVRMNLPDEELQRMAETSQDDFIQTIIFLDRLEKIGTLSRALSAAYFCKEEKSRVSNHIKRYLFSEKEILREGALEGLMDCKDPDILKIIKTMASRDSSAEIRAMAREIINGEC